MNIDDINETNIWSCRENNPELIIEDCRSEFNMTEEQLDKLRKILIIRGVGKWMLGRRLFIKLKHLVKERLKEEHESYKIEKEMKITVCALTRKQLVCFLSELNQEMQHIAKLPRWVEFPHTVTHNWKKIEKEIVIKGRHC